jgi:hypothetical protein
MGGAEQGRLLRSLVENPTASYWPVVALEVEALRERHDGQVFVTALRSRPRWSLVGPSCIEAVVVERPSPR